MSFNFFRRSPKPRDKSQTDEPHVTDTSHTMQTLPDTETPGQIAQSSVRHYGAVQPHVAGSNDPVTKWHEKATGHERVVHNQQDTNYDADSYNVDPADAPDHHAGAEAKHVANQSRDYFPTAFESFGQRPLATETNTVNDHSNEPTPLFTEVRDYTSNVRTEESISQHPGKTEQNNDSFSEARKPRSETKESNMSTNIQAFIHDLMEIEGATGAAIVDIASGMELGSGGNPNFDLNVAAAGNSNVIRAKLSTISDLGINESIEDIMITLESQYHLLSVLNSSTTEGLFIYLVLDRRHANLALARHKLKKLAEQISV
ncbi:hypothetical protein [Brevibacterium mcbrellneri]|nr:hypothetical protein [Brevibacterium mcbrellneri]